MTDLKKGRELLAKATPGPWLVSPDDPHDVAVSDGQRWDNVVTGDSGVYTSEEDATLIAWAVTNAPTMIDAAEENEKLRTRIAALEAKLVDAWYEGYEASSLDYEEGRSASPNPYQLEQQVEELEQSVGGE